MSPRFRTLPPLRLPTRFYQSLLRLKRWHRISLGEHTQVLLVSRFIVCSCGSSSQLHHLTWLEEFSSLFLERWPGHRMSSHTHIVSNGWMGRKVRRGNESLEKFVGLDCGDLFTTLLVYLVLFTTTDMFVWVLVIQRDNYHFVEWKISCDFKIHPGPYFPSHLSLKLAQNNYVILNNVSICKYYLHSGDDDKKDEMKR